MRKFDRVMVLGDAIRGKNGADYNTPWLFALIQYYVGYVFKIPVSQVYGEKAKSFQQEFTKAYGGKKNWFEVYSEKFNGHILKLVENTFKDSLVIAFELHPVLRGAFDHIGIPYIEIINHPIRFLDDLVLGFRSNIPSVNDQLLRHEVKESIFYRKAALLKAEYAVKEFKSNSNILANSAVFFAQTNIDLSLLEGNVVHSLYDYMDQFIDLTKTYDHVYYKIHPMGRNQQLIDVIKKIKNVIVPKPGVLDTYGLFSHPNIKECVAISSGTLYEARYFGKKTKYFYKPPFNFSTDRSLSLTENVLFVPIYQSFLREEFWIDILQGIMESSVDKNEFINNDIYENTMRCILKLSWGYNDNKSVVVEKFMQAYNQQPTKKIEKHPTAAERLMRFLRGR